MAMYASASDLLDRYPEQDLVQLTDPAGAELNPVKLERALADASSEIDGYLLGRYLLPLVQVPEILRLLACDIAMYRLQALRPMAGIEDARKRYEDATRYLKLVSTGEVQLGLSTADAPAQQGAGPEVVSSRRTFSRTSMKGL